MVETTPTLQCGDLGLVETTSKHQGGYLGQVETTHTLQGDDLIQEKRRRLVSKMKEAKRDDKQAWIAYDTLYTNGEPVSQ
ncbi:hypothetical protein DPMN_125259 [Dreissena polymorpha]|uniref:Uncharacterized protein n=1 Tax=Dreissena polymorpha TaxID=45954 RepID=A0A9D4JX06_DREPO|nr:hypothetical protein DPMN_125259 [Dreissena polymorpha]